MAKGHFISTKQKDTFSNKKVLFQAKRHFFLEKRTFSKQKGTFSQKRDTIEGGHKMGNYQGQGGHFPPSMYVSLTSATLEQKHTTNFYNFDIKISRNFTNGEA